MNTVGGSPESMPVHVAIVMDGNGRWAKRRLLPRIGGHRQGLTALRRCIEACLLRDIGVLTVFAFSSENWRRPGEEVNGLLDLMANALVREIPRLVKQDVRVFFVGERQGLSAQMQASLAQAEADTAAGSRLILNVCFNYGGRWDIAQAAAKIAALRQEVTEDSLARAMALSHVPDPDLLIRTGGEYRMSNFLLWQCAYSELYFTKVLWPDFDADELDEALRQYAQRERRFGKTSEQLISC